MHTVRELKLWYKRGGQDILLGTAFDFDLPREGDVLAHPCKQGTTWKVVLVYRYLTQPGSLRWRDWQLGHHVRPSPVDVFVEPATGPFED